MSVSRYNIYQNNLYFIALGNNRDTTINPSNQFHFKKLRKCGEVVRLLKEKFYKMKSIVRILLFEE